MSANINSKDILIKEKPWRNMPKSSKITKLVWEFRVSLRLQTHVYLTLKFQTKNLWSFFKKRTQICDSSTNKTRRRSVTIVLMT